MGNRSSTCNNIDLTPSNDFQRLLSSDRPTDEIVTEMKKMLQEAPELATSKTEEDYPVIFISARRGETPILKCLIEYGADVNSEHNGWAPLHFACGAEKLEAVATLIDHGANIDYDNDGKGKPVSFQAVEDGNLDILKVLKEKGADLNKIFGSMSFLHLAAKKDRAEICNYLIEQGLDINLKKKDGWTPLMLASANNQKRAVSTLLDNNPDLNLTNNQNKTALYLAAAQGHPKVVQKLLQAGADPNILSHKGKSALRRAREKNGLKVVTLLKEHHAIDEGPVQEAEAADERLTRMMEELEGQSGSAAERLRRMMVSDLRTRMEARADEDHGDIFSQFLRSNQESSSQAIVPFKDEQKDELIHQLMADVYLLKHKVAQLEAKVNK